MHECPACGHVNIEGADQCEECQADLYEAGLPQNTAAGLGQRLLEDSIMELKPQLRITVPPGTKVSEVARIMVDQHISAVMIVENNQLTGVFTERDFLMKIADRYDEVADQPISKFMTPGPDFVETEHSIAFGLNQMAVKQHRHVPIVGDGKPVAMVRTKDVLKYVTQHYRQSVSQGR